GEVSLFTTGPTTLGAVLVDTNNNPLVDPTTNRTIRVLDTRQAGIVDLDPSTPGFGFIPVGGLPEHIRTSADGCRAVTANVGTCDLAVIDVWTLIRKASDPNVRGTFPDDVVRRVPIRAKGGAILNVRPTWIEMAPSSSNLASNTCDLP